MGITLRNAIPSDCKEIEKIHLKFYAEIGQREGDIEASLNRPNLINLTAVNENNEVVGYIIANASVERSLLEWIGVKIENVGIGKILLNAYFEECKKRGIKFILVMTRNRFKKALVRYMKNDFNIIGVFQGTDGDLMIQLRKEL